VSAAKNSRIFEAAWAAGGRTNFPPEYLPPATLTIMKYYFILDAILMFIGITIFRECVVSESTAIRLSGMVVGIIFIRIGLIFKP
jgi:hypothetical protein